MIPINTGDIIGQIIMAFTTQTTGSLFLSLFIIMIFLIAICIMFGIPLEFSAILIFPFVLSCMAYFNDFTATGSILLIYIAIILTKNWLFR